MKLTIKGNQIQLDNISIYPDVSKGVLRNLENDKIVTDSKEALKAFFELERTLVEELEF